MTRGRVLNLRDGALTLWVDGHVKTFHELPDGSCRPGDLVVLDGGRISVVKAHPTGEYPPPGSSLARLTDPTVWRRLRQRQQLFDTTRRFFSAQGMLEVQTPILVASAGTEVHLDCVPAMLRPRWCAEPEQRYLITSPEYHMKRLLAAGSPAIFNLSKVFRDGERGGRHRPEFTMLEWYRPWADYRALMEDCEGWLLALSSGRPQLCWQGDTFDLRPPWRRLTFREALRERGGIDNPDALDTDAQLQVLVDRVEPTLGVDAPEFLTEYPIAMASLARPAPHDPTVAERFELYIGGLELGNAFSELTDAAEQRRRCVAENAERAALGKAIYPLDEAFLGALEHGMPPAAGIAVGMDRVAMLLTDAPTIDDVLAF